MDGVSKGDYSGISVSSGGDINGDGYDDILVGAPASNVHGATGDAYVVFGKASGFDATLSLRDLNGTNGFRIEGPPGRG